MCGSFSQPNQRHHRRRFIHEREALFRKSAWLRTPRAFHRSVSDVAPYSAGAARS
jgi:hypothetical protein